MESAFARLNAFANSAAGQQQFGAVFASLTQIGRALVPVVGAIVQGFARLSPVVARVVTALGPGLQAAVTGVSRFLAAAGPGLTQFATGLSGMARAVLPAMAPLGRAIGQLAAAVKPLLPIIGQLARMLLQNAARAFSAVAAAVRPVANALAKSLRPVLPILAQAFRKMSTTLTPVIRMLGQELAKALPKLTPLFKTMATVIRDQVVPFLRKIIPIGAQVARWAIRLGVAILPILVSALRWVWQRAGNLADIFGKVLGAFKSVGSYVTDTLTSTLNGLKGTIDSVVGFIGDLIDKIRGALDNVRELGSAIGNMPSLPKFDLPGFAHGGVVTRPTLATVGEGGKREVIIPLTKPRRAEQLAEQAGLLQMLARRGTTPGVGAGGGSRSNRRRGGTAGQGQVVREYSPTFNINGAMQPHTVAAMVSRRMAAVVRGAYG